jgi:hypothetical protein
VPFSATHKYGKVALCALGQTYGPDRYMISTALYVTISLKALMELQKWHLSEVPDSHVA